jgi:hypothetical protein
MTVDKMIAHMMAIYEVIEDNISVYKMTVNDMIIGDNILQKISNVKLNIIDVCNLIMLAI